MSLGFEMSVVAVQSVPEGIFMTRAASLLWQVGYFFRVLLFWSRITYAALRVPRVTCAFNNSL